MAAAIGDCNEEATWFSKSGMAFCGNHIGRNSMNRKPIKCGDTELPYDDSCGIYGVEFEHGYNPRVCRNENDNRKWSWYLAVPEIEDGIVFVSAFLNCDVRFETAQEAADHMNQTLKGIGKKL